jgi:putative tricarboxylic transport membrane protein
MNTDRISSLFWLGVGVVTLYGSVQLGLGTLREPGSGFLSFLAGVFISLVALIIFLQSFIRWRGVPLDLKTHWSGVNWHRSLVISLITLGFILLLEGLGFFITSFLLLFLIFRYVERLSWRKAIIIPVLTLSLTYLLFNVFLKSTLPRGIFGI